MNHASKPDLQRTIGAKSLAINAINLTIGAGIFVVPALVAEKLGPASIIAYFMCAGLAILIMLCFAEIGSKITRSGGSYAYVAHAFGQYPGFLINILFWLGYALISDAAIANAMVDMMSLQFPVLRQKIPRTFFFLVLFGFFAWINIRGTRKGASLVWINTSLKLLPLILLVVVGVFHIEVGNLRIETWPLLQDYGEIALILFFAFQGTETALNISGEVKNPQKSIPAGIFMGIFGVLIFYLLIQTVAQGVVGADLATNTEAPLAAASEKIFGNFGFQMMILAGIISIFGVLSGDMLASPRLLFAGSQNGLYPKFLSKVHPKFKTPAYAIVAFAVLSFIVASLGEFKQLALVSSSAVLVVYLAVALATIKVRLNKKEQYPNSFNIPGGITIPILAIVVILWFLSNTTKDEIIAMSAFLVIASVFYFLYSRKRIRRES